MTSELSASSPGGEATVTGTGERGASGTQIVLMTLAVGQFVMALDTTVPSIDIGAPGILDLRRVRTVLHW